jgi:hypothetical protein
MAHNCTNCGCSKISCGCGDSFLTTPPPCPTPADCPEAQPCSEVFDAACIVYTGPDLQCGTDDVVLTNTSLNLALEDIIGYFCTQPASDITVVAAGNGIDVDANTVGNTTTYTVSTLGAMRAQSAPLNMNAITPTIATSLIIDGVTQIMSEVYDDDAAYNPLTGIWTCPASGRYNLSFYVHMSNETLLVTNGFTSGMVIAGIVASSGFYAVNTMTIGGFAVRYIDITGQALGMDINFGTQLKLNILNLTNVNYTSDPGDVARFVVQRVR